MLIWKKIGKLFLRGVKFYEEVFLKNKSLPKTQVKIVFGICIKAIVALYAPEECRKIEVWLSNEVDIEQTEEKNI